MDFKCIDDCSQCCIEREYYPSKQFGKIGVLILPEEKEKIESLAKELGLSVKILPRLAESETVSSPRKILAYQMMGVDPNGNTCPFLDVHSDKRSSHGGYLCKIYQNRPLACSAYPVVETNPISLDTKCKFCKECGTATSNLDSEIDAIIKIKSKINFTGKCLWRFATGVGDPQDKSEIQSGWILT